MWSLKWREVFADSSVHHLSKEYSDHAPLLGKFEMEQGRQIWCFKFQDMWLKHHNFLDVVRQSWNQHVLGSFVYFCLQVEEIEATLIIWNKKPFWGCI